MSNVLLHLWWDYFITSARSWTALSLTFRDIPHSPHQMHKQQLKLQHTSFWPHTFKFLIH